MNCEIISAILIGVIIGILSSEGKDFINRIRFTNKIIQMIHKEIEMNIKEENRKETIRTSDIELNFPKYPSRKCAVCIFRKDPDTVSGNFRTAFRNYPDSITAYPDTLSNH